MEFRVQYSADGDIHPDEAWYRMDQFETNPHNMYYMLATIDRCPSIRKAIEFGYILYQGKDHEDSVNLCYDSGKFSDSWLRKEIKFHNSPYCPYTKVMGGKLNTNVASLDRAELKMRKAYLEMRLNEHANKIHRDPLFSRASSEPFHILPFKYADIRSKIAPDFEPEYSPIACFLQAVNH